ncbi:MAG: hypothetical protein LQ341_003154 [Variospora aurantia]|nr:MAG: hypothetical protein LQ341_003154 [Variospora aurantia]
MSASNSSLLTSSPAGASKSKKGKRKKGGTKGKPHADSASLNGMRTEEDHEHDDGDGQDQEPHTPVEEVISTDHDQGVIPGQSLPNGNVHSNGVPSRSAETKQLTMHGKEAGKPVEGDAEVDEDTASLERAQKNHVHPMPGSTDVIGNTEARLEILVQERAALKEQVSELRRSLEEIQEKHEEGMNSLRSQLDKRSSEKEHAETQYRNLLGKVNTIRSQLGERLKADAEDLSQAKGRIEELEEQCEGLRTENEARTAELSTLVEEGEQRSKELSSLRNRTTLSQQNWAKEREDLVQRERMALGEFEAAKQAMQDWEILAMEERSIREDTAERLSDLEEQLHTQTEAYKRASSERDTQSLTVDGLQRALREIQDARRKELRDIVENTQAQVGSLQKQLQEAQQQASESARALEISQQELQRALPYEKEVKEKNLLIGKLRHEAVILNDHLTKALRYLKKGKPEENIDKQLMTNHFLHFLALERADPKKFQVLQIIAALLGWTDEQREQAGLARPGASNPSLRVPISPWHRTPSTPALSTGFFPESNHQKESLAELWSDFLEQEAQEGAKSPQSPGDSTRSPSTSSTSKPSGFGTSPKP